MNIYYSIQFKFKDKTSKIFHYPPQFFPLEIDKLKKFNFTTFRTIANVAEIFLSGSETIINRPQESILLVTKWFERSTHKDERLLTNSRKNLWNEKSDEANSLSPLAHNVQSIGGKDRNFSCI